jgi:predicted dehydrogenase
MSVSIGMPPNQDQAPVRWGILGTAGIALRQVIPALQHARNCTIVAIASRDHARARAAADRFGIPGAYGSYQELLDDPAVEAVYNPLPNHLHVRWSIRAVEAGKHVLCEKPIALTAAEARMLLTARDHAGVQVAEAFMVRTHPRWLKARELVHAGRIGELKLVTGHFSYSRRDPADIRSHPEWGGGVLMDIGCYPVTLARWLFGAEPVSVTAMLERDPELQVDRLTSAMLRFPAGQATFSVGGQLVPWQRMQLFGTAGRIEVDMPFNVPSDRQSRLLVDDGRDLRGGGIETIEIPAVNQFALQGERFAEAVRGGGTVPVTLEDSIGNMAVIDALFRAAMSGRWESPA